MDTTQSRISDRAFTLLELLLVIAVLAFVAAALGTALAKSGPGAQSVLCLSSKRQLWAAWRMYADDNSEKLVVNVHGANAVGGVGDPLYGPAWVEGWLDWTTRADNTNMAFLVDKRYAKIAPYINTNAYLLKCPADRFLSSSQIASGWSQRPRSVALSLSLGPGNAQAGPWDPIYKQELKLSDLIYPSPAETTLFLDEHPDSINDPGFFNPRQTLWVDVPATYHEGGAGFAFADGHTEIHRWSASLTQPRAQTVLATDGFYINNLAAAAGDVDIHWMSYHSGRVATNSY